MKEFWEERYAADDYAYGDRPNSFFDSTIKGLKPGRLLLPAEGEGRNAVHAARLGWEVVAFDFSQQGQSKAMELARKHNVEIDYHLASYATFKAEPASFDAVALIYAHMMPDQRESFHRLIHSLLAPGAILILEAFTPEQLRNESGGPKDESMLYHREMLRDDFCWLDIDHLQHEEIHLEEGFFHRGEASVVRLVGRKPGVEKSTGGKGSR